MLAGMQGEGTRMPLEDDDDEEEQRGFRWYGTFGDGCVCMHVEFASLYTEQIVL